MLQIFMMDGSSVIGVYVTGMQIASWQYTIACLDWKYFSMIEKYNANTSNTIKFQ